MFKKPTMLGLTLALLSATSCAPNTTATAPRAISEYCLIAKGITFSKKQPAQVETAANTYDTDSTVAQVEEHDLVFERLCGDRPAPEQ